MGDHQKPLDYSHGRSLHKIGKIDTKGAIADGVFDKKSAPEWPVDPAKHSTLTMAR
ncbi:hypothetical protein BH23PLA1_BH23PLA1_00660 [soil metagenome]